MLVDTTIRLPGDGGSNDIIDGEKLIALALGFAHGREGIDGFTRLAERKEKGVLAERRVPVAKLRGIVDLDRHPGKTFYQVFGNQAGVPGTAAGQEVKPIDMPKIHRGDVQTAKLGGTAILGETAAHGVFKGRRL